MPNPKPPVPKIDRNSDKVRVYPLTPEQAFPPKKRKRIPVKPKQ